MNFRIQRLLAIVELIVAGTAWCHTIQGLPDYAQVTHQMFVRDEDVHWNTVCLGFRTTYQPLMDAKTRVEIPSSVHGSRRPPTMTPGGGTVGWLVVGGFDQEFGPENLFWFNSAMRFWNDEHAKLLIPEQVSG